MLRRLVQTTATVLLHISTPGAMPEISLALGHQLQRTHLVAPKQPLAIHLHLLLDLDSQEQRLQHFVLAISVALKLDWELRLRSLLQLLTIQLL